MPVVNMGLHGGLGNVFHERMAKYNVKKGDIYVICHNSFNGVDEMEPSQAELAWITIENHIELWKLLRSKDIKPMMEAWPVYLKKSILLWLNSSGNQKSGIVYDRCAFNKYGDIEWDNEDEKYQFKEGDIIVPSISENVADRINELNDYMIQRGATLLIAGYPIADTPYTPDHELYIKFQEELTTMIDAPIISNYENYFYPENYFYNAILHLNNKGKKVRTQQLIDDLKKYLEEQKRIDYTYK